MLYKKIHRQRLREFWIGREFRVGRKFKVGNIGKYEYEVISKPFINCPEKSICIRIKKKILGIHVSMNKEDITWLD